MDTNGLRLKVIPEDDPNEGLEGLWDRITAKIEEVQNGELV